MRLPSQEYLQECFNYDPETGALTWKERPRSHFTSNRSWLNWNARFPDRPALNCINGQGYKTGAFTADGQLYAVGQHKVIWKWMTGDDAPELLDHEDLNRSNNRFVNLRLASRSLNGANASIRSDNTTGFKGVSRRGTKFHARISHQGVETHLGFFDTPELAAAAYAEKATELFGKFARTA